MVLNTSIGRGSNASGSEVDHGKFAVVCNIFDQFIRGLDFLSISPHLVRVHGGQPLDLAVDRTCVAHSLNNVAGAGFALGAQESSSLCSKQQYKVYDAIKVGLQCRRASE